MDSWEALIVQWVNCLHENSNDYICNIEELKDGSIYYKFISRLKAWNSKEYGDCKRDIIFEFLQDEYPNFACKNDLTDELCIGLLVLSRLSLEPVFHKFLCVNLSYDLQIKVKSILETIYALGKDLTAEDLCKTFSLSEKTDFKALKTRSKRILEEFLNSPVVRSVHSEKKMYEQTKHIRHLRADIETLRYEKSELIEDIKAQRKQINELQNKLQDTVSELKQLRANTTISKNNDLAKEDKDIKSIEQSYKNELQSLEKYVAELQNDNCKLQDDKSDLINEITLYKGKCRTSEEKNLHNDQIIEEMLLQIEKKEEEMLELKMKYEELRTYFTEKSMHLSSQSFEVDDRIVSEISFNKSEALSSVIEIQLLDAKKDLTVMQTKFTSLNSILNAVMEEYVKVKSQYNILSSLSLKVKPVVETKCEKCELREKEAEKMFNDCNDAVLKCEKCELREKEAEKVVINDSDNIMSLEPLNVSKEQCILSKLMIGKEIKLSFADIFKNNLSNRNDSLIVEFVSRSNRMKGIKKLKNNIMLASYKNKNEDLFMCKDSYYTSTNFSENSEASDKSKSLAVYEGNKNINFINNTSVLVKFCKILSQGNWHSQLLDFVQILNRFLKIEAVEMDEEKNDLLEVFDTLLSYKRPIDSNVDKETIIKNIELKCANTQTEEECNRRLSFYKSNMTYLQSLWTSLCESTFHTFKIHKVLIYLNKNWDLVLDSSKNLIDGAKALPECKELLEKRVIIEKKLKDVDLKNSQTLSMNLVKSVQFVTLLNNSNDLISNNYENLQDWFTSQLSAFDLINQEQLKLQHQTYMAKKIITIKRRIENYSYLTDLIEEKCTKYILSSQKPTTSEVKEEEISTDKKTTKEEDITQSLQFRKYMKEIHEKYESKLEKMKEKMKSVYNNQMCTMKQEQESLAMSKLEALQSKFENQCFNHSEELKKYKKHISELSTQLWDVGEKLIIEKQKKEDVVLKLKEIKSKAENVESQRPKSKHDQENFEESIMKTEKSANALQSIENTSFHKMQSVRGFQIMGNAFRTEDEEGEVFDTTYLTDMQRSRNSISSVDLNRLSILQMRNSKCKPHLKSSYPGEMQIHPAPFSEDEIKTGSTPEEVFNDSLSQSLLTGKKVKRSNRTRTTVESPRKSRRFSHIFRKPRLSLDRK